MEFQNKIDFKGIVLLTPHATDHDKQCNIQQTMEQIYRFGAHFFEVSIVKFIMNALF